MNLQNLIDNAQKLPNIPKVIQELIESFSDDDVSNNEIAQKISSDQVLTIKVLRAANSAHYGGNRKIGSVSDAVFLLGFNAVRTLVLASGLTGAFKAPEGFNINEFWHNSFAVAATCKWVARFSRDDAETAFTCGMIHNIGELLIHILMPAECLDIEKNREAGVSSSAIEKQYLGFDFAEAGAELANRWKFPNTFVQGIRYQLDPMAADEFPRLAAIMNIAFYINRMNDEGADSDAMLADFPTDLATQLGINLDKLMDKIEDTKELGTAIDELLV